MTTDGLDTPVSSRLDDIVCLPADAYLRARTMGFVVHISDDDFERLVAEEFEALPDDMVRGLENVAIVVEDQPVGQRPRLFGQYRGHPLTTRGVYGFGELPDRITLYKNNLQEHSADFDALRSRVHLTLVHEIGHYFGLDDARLRELGWA
jgi:predicted Zn-dependent protease with MMP-like domain